MEQIQKLIDETEYIDFTSGDELDLAIEKYEIEINRLEKALEEFKSK